MNKYFSSYYDALAFIRNNSLQVKPFKSEVWIYPRHEEVWTVKV